MSSRVKKFSAPAQNNSFTKLASSNGKTKTLDEYSDFLVDKSLPDFLLDLQTVPGTFHLSWNAPRRSL